MTAFVLETRFNNSQQYLNYANFLKQPLKLEMFTENRLFKNMDICEDNFIRLEDEFIFCTVEYIEKHTVEDLIGWDVEITESAKKQIGL